MPMLIGGRRYVTAGGAIGTLLVDGTPQVKTLSAVSSYTFTITTSNANDVIVIATLQNGGLVSGIASSNTTSWARRTSAASGSNPVELWYGVAASPLTSEVITVTLPGSLNSSGICMAVSGCDISTPPTSFLDPNGILPVIGTTGTPSGISTTKNVTIIIGAIRGTNDGAPPATWTDAGAGNRSNLYMGLDYKIFSSAQSGIGIADTMSTPDAWIGDALKASGQ